MQTPNPTPHCPRHTPATASIQRRFERWELDHLRTHCAELAQQVEDLTRQLHDAESNAYFWSHSHQELQEHLGKGTEDGRCIGLTQSGELLVVRTGAMQ